MELVISTFNIQNKYKIKRYNGIEKTGDHVKELSEFIYNNHIDIIGTQELTRRFKNRLLEYIKDDYDIVGKYRFTSIGEILPIINKINESTCIISNRQIVKHKTKHFPYFFGIPRILTIADIKVGNRIIKIINTHLDHISEISRRVQLKYLYNVIRKSNIPVIVMGDFNTTVSNKYFCKFTEKLKEIDYKRVEINESTHKTNKLPIDHIFLPNKWQIKEKNVPDLISNISDHKPIIIKIKM